VQLIENKRRRLFVYSVRHIDEKFSIKRHTEAIKDYQENLTKFIDIARKHGATSRTLNRLIIVEGI